MLMMMMMMMQRMSWNVKCQCQSMTPSRNDRRYILRSVQSSPGRSFLSSSPPSRSTLATSLRTTMILTRWVFVGASMPHRCLLPNELPFSNETFQPVVQVPPSTSFRDNLMEMLEKYFGVSGRRVENGGVQVDQLDLRRARRVSLWVALWQACSNHIWWS